VSQAGSSTRRSVAEPGEPGSHHRAARGSRARQGDPRVLPLLVRPKMRLTIRRPSGTGDQREMRPLGIRRAGGSSGGRVHQPTPACTRCRPTPGMPPWPTRCSSGRVSGEPSRCPQCRAGSRLRTCSRTGAACRAGPRAIRGGRGDHVHLRYHRPAQGSDAHPRQPELLGLPAALEGLREELESVWEKSAGRAIRFRVSEVTLTLEAAALSRTCSFSACTVWPTPPCSQRTVRRWPNCS
jgi:hypothetical protein